MTPDLEKSITEKYPSLFANIGQRGSPMKFGLAVGDGWAGIISTMCFILNQKDTAKTFRFDQIKEKFGLLRVYHSGGNEYMAGVVRMAEDISGSICEVCGQPGEQRKGGWIRTLCDRCHSPITTGDEIERLRLSSKSDFPASENEANEDIAGSESVRKKCGDFGQPTLDSPGDGTEKVMAKLIIERSDKGVYWYCESDKHHLVCEPQRQSEGLRRVDWNDLAEECEIQSGTYMVVPIVEV